LRCGFRFLGLPLPLAPRFSKKGPFLNRRKGKRASGSKKASASMGKKLHRSGRVDKLPLRFYFKIQIRISKFK
jgi:hypothetical protein